MHRIFIYNTSWKDLLTLIKYLIENKEKPDNIHSHNYLATLFDQCINLNLANNLDIEKYWLTKTNKQIYQICYYVFLSTHPQKELIIYYFLLNALKYQEQTIYHRNLKCVNLALKISKYVNQEKHKLKGFIRFKELENHYLLAEIEPENNILKLLSFHFQKRLSNEHWIIKDNKYKQVCIYDTKNLYLLNDTDLNDIKLSFNEYEFENLWKTFFKSISIEQRQNRSKQMSFMPKKYWKYIIEMEDKL